jgi:16S rRNA (cytidine1402-2'-O)-methyltransferase
MASKKRQELPKKSDRVSSAPGRPGASAGVGTLYVVATPIGNLEDLTPRARRVLGEVDGILCEDTRMTAKLLNAAEVVRADGASFEGRLTRFDQHATSAQLDYVEERLRSGENLALVSDAGTPAISDPGAELVARIGALEIPLVVIPGVSALTAFLAGAGFAGESPVFRGFFPRKKADRDSELDGAEGLPFSSVFVWFESPERVVEAIDFLAGRFPESRAVAAKELSKIHERFYYGSLKNIASHIHSSDTAGEIRGEWVIGVAFAAKSVLSGDREDEWSKALICLINSGVSASHAAREISQVFGISRNEVYKTAVELAKTREE